jgi:hypothetical protein
LSEELAKVKWFAGLRRLIRIPSLWGKFRNLKVEKKYSTGLEPVEGPGNELGSILGVQKQGRTTGSETIEACRLAHNRLSASDVTVTPFGRWPQIQLNPSPCI